MREYVLASDCDAMQNDPFALQILIWDQPQNTFSFPRNLCFVSVTPVSVTTASPKARCCPSRREIRISPIRRTQTAFHRQSRNVRYLFESRKEISASERSSPNPIVYVVPVGMPLMEWLTPPQRTRLIDGRG